MDHAVVESMALEHTDCAFCGRFTLTRGHHIVPRATGGKHVIPTCVSCEDFIHNTWSHKELRDDYSSVARIQADERYRRFRAWLLKQPGDAIHRSRRNRRRPAKP